MITIKIFGCVVAVFLLAGCNKAATPAPEIAARTFSVNGVVKQLQPDGKTVVIQHEAISNYMEAMTMPFEVHDTNVLRGVKAGDAITFHLVITEKEGWIDQITERKKSGHAKASAPGVIISGAVEPLDEGETLPDYHFTNELGQPVSLSQYKGQVFAFTFFFTSCPYPNFCPRITGNFAATAAQLAQTSNAPAQWHLFSITFDPQTDSPARLQSYGQIQRYDPTHWSFLTGDPEQISELADNVGQTYARENASISHNIRTVVVNPSFQVQRILRGNTWSPADLVREMVQAGGH